MCRLRRRLHHRGGDPLPRLNSRPTAVCPGLRRRFSTCTVGDGFRSRGEDPHVYHRRRCRVDPISRSDLCGTTVCTSAVGSDSPRVQSPSSRCRPVTPTAPAPNNRDGVRDRGGDPHVHTVAVALVVALISPERTVRTSAMGSGFEEEIPHVHLLCHRLRLRHRIRRRRRRGELLPRLDSRRTTVCTSAV